ncbi:MAG: hypothetical protein OXD31_06975 [Chloroflexi bacterium]|nr:hypothetical protein [Chloroflexota bacterium]
MAMSSACTAVPVGVGLSIGMGLAVGSGIVVAVGLEVTVGMTAIMAAVAVGSGLAIEEGVAEETAAIGAGATEGEGSESHPPTATARSISNAAPITNFRLKFRYFFKGLPCGAGTALHGIRCDPAPGSYTNQFWHDHSSPSNLSGFSCGDLRT